jgi:hypothetical protein
MKKNSLDVHDEKVQDSSEEPITNSRDGEGESEFDPGRPIEKPIAENPLEK